MAGRPIWRIVDRNALIKRMNTKMDDGQIEFGLRQDARGQAIESGDAATMGIGIITEERWKKTRDFLVEAGLLKSDTDYLKSMTTEFIKDLKVVM